MSAIGVTIAFLRSIFLLVRWGEGEAQKSPPDSISRHYSLILPNPQYSLSVKSLNLSINLLSKKIAFSDFTDRASTMIKKLG